MPKLPEEIHVYWSEEDVDPFLLVCDELEEAAESAGDEVEIGTYVLSHTGKYAIEKTVTEL